MKKECAQAYVSWYEGKTVNVNFLFSTLKIYVVFLGISVVYSYMSGRMILTSVLAGVLLLYGGIAVFLKHKLHKLTYEQRFSLTGWASLFGSLVFLLFSMMIVETVECWPGYYILLPAAWLLVIFGNIGWTWRRAKRGYYVEKKEGKGPKQLVGVGIIFPMAGVVVARISAPLLEQNVIRTIVIWGFFLISAAFTLGCPNLLKVHLVKKYELTGPEVAVYHRKPGKENISIWRRGKPVLLVLLFFVVLPVVVIAIGAIFFNW